MADQPWVELRRLVENAWQDKEVREHPPTESDERGYLADTVADHIYAFVKDNLNR